MLYYKCIGKERDKNGKIARYLLVDFCGSRAYITSSELKALLKTGQASVINLTLTSDNRLIDKVCNDNTPIIDQTSSVQKFIAKAKMMGVEISDYVFSADLKTLIKYTGKSEKPLIPPVEIIDCNCFEGNQFIQSVVIPESVRILGQYAFNRCDNIREFVLQTHELKAYSCSISLAKVENFTIPDGKYKLSHQALLGSSYIGKLNTINIQNKSIFENNSGYSSFFGVSAKRIVLPEGISEIPDFMFQSISVEDINIPNTVTSIGNGAFAKAKISKIHFGDNITHIGCEAFRQATIGDIHLGNGIKVIYDGTFEKSEIHRINIPDSVVKIGEDAFNGCEIHGDFSIPDSVKVVAARAFREIDVKGNIEHIPTKMYTIGEFAFYLSKFTGNLDLRNAVSVEKGAFIGNEFDTVLISNKLNKIGIGGISGCCAEYKFTADNHKFITNGTMVAEKLDNGKFAITAYACKCKHNRIKVSDNNIVEIKAFAFAFSPNITSVEILIPIKMGTGAFAYCEKLKRVKINKNSTVGANAYAGAFPEINWV